MASRFPDDARAQDIAQKSESMARELSHKREQRRQERVRQQALDDPQGVGARPSSRTPLPPPAARSPSSGPTSARVLGRADERSPRARPEERDALSQRAPGSAPSVAPAQADAQPAVLDDVATEIEELLRDVGLGWRRSGMPDRITVVAALFTLVGVLLPWISDDHRGDVLGLGAGGALHAALAVTAIVLSVDRARALDARGEQLSGRPRRQRDRRTSLWQLLLGATSTLLCTYFLVIYGLQRGTVPGLEVRFGLYVTLAAGMGLSYGGFSRFFARAH